ncbi:uncharacterized protein LOC133189041 [Saccostrea echinata]|uniref:uncharacterized protein LOC133189041 n=1 Tax=Saccostrea echinata TaxID=191078 RepID=UPI002A81F9FD|nr:uncharacterized protein LOC133189041 [Saccostrea echinata]
MKFSDLESKQKILYYNITEKTKKLQQNDEIMKGRITVISGEIKRTKDMTTSLQHQINRNKCQSGLVKSSYTTKPNMVSDKSVRFARPFQNKPNVVFGLSVFDSSSKTNARLNSYLIKLDRYGFTLRISAWGGTVMYQTHYFWMACP